VGAEETCVRGDNGEYWSFWEGVIWICEEYVVFCFVFIVISNMRAMFIDTYENFVERCLRKRT